MRRFLLLAVGIFGVCFNLLAVSAQPCQKVVIAGNSEWPPYTIVSPDPDMADKNMAHGIGMEIAKKIFAELDIQVEEQIYDNTEQIFEAARAGKIDLLVSTYKSAEIPAYLQLLHPAYVTDHITIALLKNDNINIENWDSLVGLKGVEPSSFQPDENIVAIINNYLHVSKQAGLLSTLQGVLNGQYSYVLGADLQLSYALKVNELTNKMFVKKDLFKTSDVYMAFVTNSVCSPYSIYLQKRLQDYKNNGTVEKIVTKYIY